MKRILAAAALAAAVAAPASVLTATTAGAAPAVTVASSGSASGSADLVPRMPPSCVGKYDPLLFALQWYTGTYPRYCL